MTQSNLILESTISGVHDVCMDTPSSQGFTSGSRMTSKEAYIHRLPNELLIYIFYVLVVDAAEMDPNLYAVSYYPYSWMNILEVCLRWRNIGDGTDMLWSHVAIDDDMTEEKLALILLSSRKCGLHVTAFTTSCPVSNVFETCMTQVLQDLPRIRSIKARIPISCCKTIIGSFLGSSPNLRSLVFQGGELCPVPDKIKSFPDVTRFPALQRFVMQGFVVRQLDSFLNHHTNLREIDILQFEDTSRMCSFLEVLANLPLLESITLSSGNIGTNNDPPASISTVVLPHLRFLGLWLNLPCDALFIEHLIFPSTTKIDTILCAFTHNSEDVGEGSLTALNVLVSKLKGSGVIGTPPALTTVHFFANEDSDIVFAAHYKHFPDIVSPKSEDFCLRVTFHGDDFDRPPVDRRWVLWQQLPLSQLKYVSLDDSVGMDLWTQIAEKLDYIEVLNLRNTSTFGTFGSLYLDSSPHASPGCFPSLHTLSIVTKSVDAESGLNGLLQYLRICQVDGGLKLIIHCSQEPQEDTVIQCRSLVEEFLLNGSIINLYA